MKTVIALNVLIALLIISLGNPFFAVAEEKGDVVIDEQKLKAMLEEFVDENSADPILQRYGFDMTKSFLEMDLREGTWNPLTSSSKPYVPAGAPSVPDAPSMEKIYHYWSLGPWTVEIDQYGEYIVHQSTDYGPNLATLTLTFSVHGERYEITDRDVLELELAE